MSEAEPGVEVATPDGGLAVPRRLNRGAHPTAEAWLSSARSSVELLADVVGRADLDGVEVLDVGCGTKVTKVLLDEGRPIGRYVGVDVEPAVIEWLREHVADPRFEFHHLDARNELYNPAGRPLAEYDELPVGGRRFDLLCLFSVFTHLAPDDYVAMLRLLRRHVRPDGRLLFSLFIGHPLGRSDELAAALEAAIRAGDPEVKAGVEAALADEDEPDYQEGEPSVPLLQSVYSRKHALALIEGTGWEVLEVREPLDFIQHHIIARPV